MASKIYPKCIDLAFDEGIDWGADNIRLCFVNSFAFNAAHDFLDDVPGGNRVAFAVTELVNLGGKSLSGGKFIAADQAYVAVTGSVVQAIIVYMAAASEATSPLLFYIDTGTNIPFTPNGGNVTIDFDGTNGI